MIDSAARRGAVPGVHLPLLLLLSLLAINALAVWGIFAARNSAEASARQDLELQTAAHARALEAALAVLRGDFIFLAQAPPLGRGLAALDNPDPTVRRWNRRDVEGALLLFLEAHPAVERIVVRDPYGLPVIAAGRRRGAPVLLRPEDLPRPEAEDGSFFVGIWPLGVGRLSTGTVEALLRVDRLLASALPGVAAHLSLVPDGAPRLSSPPAAVPALAVPVREPRWLPAIDWRLVRSAATGELAQSFEALAGRYRTTVLLNLAVLTVALLLSLLAWRQARRVALLKAENDHHAQVRELERRVLHNERLASVGRLAAGLAHEINNPLEGMANYLALLEDDLRAGRTRAALGLTGKVREGVERTAGITRRVLAFAHPGGGPTVDLDLWEVLAGTVELARADPAFRRIALAVETPAERGGLEAALPVRGNRATLGQLFLNLLLNACQVQPHGGAIAVRASAAGGRVVVTIDDRGPGIPAEAAGRLFEPFYSTRGSTGLGLAICGAIAAEHGGEIRACNRPGGGARFEVEIPLTAREMRGAA
jgi:signal transduction histidine kinase